MDFVEGLPVSENKDIILVVVDRFTKYAHFISLKHPINVRVVAKAFSDNVFKLHGLPTVIVSTSYHPQTDGQTERVNQCLENYLRHMAFLQPKKWHHWLTPAEWWYNNSFHTSLNMTQFQALYGRPPPQIAELLLPIEEVNPELTPNSSTTAIAQQIKANLQKAQDRMKLHADKNRKGKTAGSW
jgi:hypothetical protein